MNPRDADSPYQLPPALAFLSRLWRLNHSLERRSLLMERQLGVTAPQRLILRCVGKFPGITAGHLARLMHLNRSSVSVALKRLERAALVTRRRDPRDGRRSTLHLTPRGEALDRPDPRTVEAAVQIVLDQLSADDLAITARTIETLAAAIDPRLSEDP